MSDLLEDMAEDAAEQADNADTSTLNELGMRAWEIDQRIKEFEAEVKAEKKALRDLTERLIPNAMQEQGVPEFGFDTPDGKFARFTNTIRVVGSLNQAPDLEEAVTYLEAQGLVGAVKTVVSVDFTENEREDADAFRNNLAQVTNRAPHVERSLPPATLRSFVTNKLKEDPTFDYERVGMFAQNVVKISNVKR